MHLPTELDPLKAAKAQQILEGHLSASAFSRLTDFDQVDYRFNCFLTEKGEPVVELRFRTNFKLTCQRCNETMRYPLDETLILEEDAAFDPMMLLEDELILALPMIPMHSEKDCSFFKNQAYCAVQKEPQTYKPFAGLGKVMNSKE